MSQVKNLSLGLIIGASIVGSSIYLLNQLAPPSLSYSECQKHKSEIVDHLQLENMSYFDHIGMPHNLELGYDKNLDRCVYSYMLENYNNEFEAPVFVNTQGIIRVLDTDEVLFSDQIGYIEGLIEEKDKEFRDAFSKYGQ